MKVLDLFSGIGGFSLGLERAGMQTIAFCEIEEFPRKVLKKHWPGVPIAEDIRKLSYRDGVLYYDGKPIYRGPIDVICGGFPCQPFSQAGKRRGTEDDRDLWPEMFRVIKDVKPRWVCAENVTGLASMGKPISPREVESKTVQRLEDSDHYRGIFSHEEMLLVSAIVEDLESAGYRLPEATDGTPIIPVVPACAVGALHRRDRVWIVAYRIGDGQCGFLRETGQRKKGPEQRADLDGKSSGNGRHGPTCETPPHSQGERLGETGTGLGRSASRSAGSGDESKDVPDSKPQRLSEPTRSVFQEFPGTDESFAGGELGRTYTKDGIDTNTHGGVRHRWPGDVQVGRFRGSKENEKDFFKRRSQWSVEPDVGRVAHGVPARVDRLKGLGNAVVPQVVEAIGRAIMETENKSA